MLRSIALLTFLTAAVYGQNRTPVILELFTSEGCSSCPPADALLADLDKHQPVSGADLIVLSEHVDYWNQLGWKDPFSSALFSKRQQHYASITSHDEDVYTPEAIIDGRFAMVGSNRQNVIHAIESSAEKPKPPLNLSITREANTISANVTGAGTGAVWIALTQARTTSHVMNGENGGRTLQHVGVVRSLKKSMGATSFVIDANWDSDLRVIAFVQDEHSGRILQAVQKSVL